ncbi:hypothetical protein QFC20_005843 [Naganishia adeliensis]|uniref:Uncharacterized protein n=1 Tax=Naganishia adeliensis TaxID=92952 RepID=A0ACC2VIM7_9TREE|nr:hypothetical protein QFC20_005843 [Naganishia adeliensis]
MSDPFDTINSLEDTHYNEGYKSGYDHGALHGLFEGRELGQEKCFEWWEELGYLEGQAQFWRRLAEVQGREGGGDAGKKMTSRTLKSIDQLLELIHSFPTINPTPSPTALPVPTTETPPTDLPSLITRIRAKYRLICSTLGVKPRLVVRQSVEGDVMADRGDDAGC